MNPRRERDRDRQPKIAESATTARMSTSAALTMRVRVLVFTRSKVAQPGRPPARGQDASVA